MKIRGDERGMLVELLPTLAAILILVVCTVGGGWRGLLNGIVLLAAIAAGFALLMGAAALIERVGEIPAVSRFLDSAAWRAFSTAFPYLLLGALGGALGVFFAVVIAPSFLSEPAAQLRAFGLSGLAGAALFAGGLALSRRRR
jgi:hypothetical protein